MRVAKLLKLIKALNELQILYLASLLQYQVFALPDNFKKVSNNLAVGRVSAVLLEFPQENSNRHEVFREGDVSRHQTEIKSQLIYRLPHYFVLHLRSINVLFGDLETDQELRKDLVIHNLATPVEVLRGGFKRVHDVLGSWNELACLFLDDGEELEDFEMEGEELQVVGELYHPCQQLHQWVHQQVQILAPNFGEGEHPQLGAVEVLPGVDGFEALLGKVVPDIPQVKAELPNVEEANLVGLHRVDAQNLD